MNATPTNKLTTCCRRSTKKLALLSAVCGLGLVSSAFGQVTLKLDLGNAALAANGAGFTKIRTDNGTVNNGSYHQWANIAGSGLTLTMTNIDQWSPGTAYLRSDGFYNKDDTGVPFTLSGVTPGYTVTLYACRGWDPGRGAAVIYGGTTNIVTNLGDMPNPSVATLQNVGRATADANGQVSGRWYGPNAGLTGQGQIGAMIFDVGPCRPMVNLNGATPMGVQVNSTFVDPGASAIESCSGSVLTVTTNGVVNTSVVGAYTLTYSAFALESGVNVTNTATRTVNVWSNDLVQMDLGSANTTVPAPAGFTKVLQSAANMSVTIPSVYGSSYKVYFTNVSAYNGGSATSTFEKDGFFSAANVTSGFTLSNVPPGSLVTLYACWAWNGANAAATVTYAGKSTLLTLGDGITSPSTATLQNIGTSVADANGCVSGTWTGGTHEGQVGGMIFSIDAPAPHSLTVLPTGFTNNCGASVSFAASSGAGSLFQWYNNLGAAMTAATNATLVLTNLHPADSGNYKVVAYGTGWSVTNLVPVSIVDVAPPVITMNGNSVMVLKKGSTWTEPGVTAWDFCAGGSLAVTTSGSGVNTSVPGEYDLTYSATTASGIPGSVTRAVVVIDDTIQPDTELALDFQSTSDLWGTSSGFNTVQLFDVGAGGGYGTAYGDATVTVSTPDYSSSFPMSFTNISSWNQSPYWGYSHISSAGFYNYGGTPATFSLGGLGVGQIVHIYAVYGWGGASHAAKVVYGGATTALTKGITVDSPNPPTVADFQYVGSAVAHNGAVSGTWYGLNGPTSEGQIGGMIIRIQSLPAHSLVITPASATPQAGSNVTFTATVSGAPPFTYEWYDNHSQLIAGATNATLILTNVQQANVGTYTAIARNAYASATNTATIDGLVDMAPPVMTLNGVDPMVIVVNNGPYVDPGATAFDVAAQTSVPVQISNPVDATTIGSYTVTYSATTKSGTPGSITRTVNVVPVPNDLLKLDFAPTGNAVQAAPLDFVKVQNGPQLTVGNYSFTGVGGSSYNLSITNIGSYNNGNTNEPLTADGFYSAAANGPAYFTLSSLPLGMKVTLYAIYAWDGAGKYANVFFGATNTQIVVHGDPGLTPDLTNFTRIGAALVNSNCLVTGRWQGPGGPNTEGQVGAMIIQVGTNTAPAANALVMSAGRGRAATLQVIGGASAPTDPDGDLLTVTAVQSLTANNGTVTTDGRNVIYTATNSFMGTDTFTYTVGDGCGGFATAAVTVNVTNTPPVASNLALNALSGQAATLKVIGGTPAPTDLDGDLLTVTAVQSPTPNNGSVTTDGTNVSYTSASGFTGTDSFTYTVGDGHGGAATATVTVTVASPNRNPIANNIVLGALSGQPATLKIIGGAFAPTDPDNDPVTVTAVQSPTANAGTVTTDGNNVIYTSALAFAGTDTFTYTVSDGRGGTATAMVTVSVINPGQGHNRLTAPALANGQWHVGFQGTPYLHYAIDTATSLSLPINWTPVVTNQADAAGAVNFTITPAQGAGFYRTRSVP